MKVFTLLTSLLLPLLLFLDGADSVPVRKPLDPVGFCQRHFKAFAPDVDTCIQFFREMVMIRSG